MEVGQLSHHTSRRFNEDLERVRSSFLTMGGLVEEQLRRALKALIDGDGEMGADVAREDRKVDVMELSIDESCSRILAMRAPAAGDLRAVVATIKAITDLERIGDECEKIGSIAVRLAGAGRISDQQGEVRQLGREVQFIVHDALDSFARMDADLALRTVRQDRAIDAAYELIQRQCVSSMMADAQQIPRTLEVMWAVRALERIGDHAKNLCEYVIYMVHGKDVRHTPPDRVEQEIQDLGLKSIS